MAMSSFYGGRKGASIVVVKHFDGIDIPQVAGSYVYKIKEYAINANAIFILDSSGNFIEPTADNYDDYTWFKQAMNGSVVQALTTAGSIIDKSVDTELAEGMRQCFEQGGATTNIVNYGEYVIIDAIAGLHEERNPDNGKVYRRGMNYDYNATTNPLAGAEYIGQIVGPSGKDGKVGSNQIMSEDNVQEYSGYSSGSYTAADGDLVPGKYVDGSGQTQYNDAVTYSWVTVENVELQRVECLFGFTVPYHVQDFTASSVSPYYNRSNETADFVNLDLVQEIDTPNHPFYQQWEISIPKGIKGDSIDNLEIYPSYAVKGAEYWTDSSMTGAAAGVLNNSYPIVNYDSNLDYLTVDMNGSTVYVSADDGDKTRLRYKETNYDRVAEGDSQYIDLGSFNDITGVSVSSNGTLTVTYSYDEPQEIANALRSLYYEAGVDASGIELQSDGTIIVHYNTGETQTYSNWLTWITNVTLSQNGTFTVLYNNNKIGGSNSYTTTIKWIDTIDINNLGTITFYYNDGTVAQRFTSYIKTISNVSIDTGSEEGAGTQKIQIEYNTNPGVQNAIGNPINYIIETVVTEYDANYPNTEPYHLLVLYSDPAKRAALANPKSYYSTVLSKTMTGWADLGYIRGEIGGLKILADFADISNLYDATTGDAIPPEMLTGTLITDNIGWSVTVEETKIYAYDYINKDWYNLGSIGDTANVSNIIVASATEPTTLKEGGIWLVVNED